MTAFRVRAESLGEVAALLDQVLSTFEQHVAAVQTTVTAVTAASWIGDDSTDFQEKWEKFTTQATGLGAVLSGLSAQLKGGEGTYNVTEAGLNGGFASRRSEDALVVQAVGAVSTNVGDGRRLHARQEAAQAAAAQAAVLAPMAAGGAVGTGKVSSARQPGERRRALNAEAIVTAPAQGTGEASDV